MKLVILDPVYFSKAHIQKINNFGQLSIYNDLPDSEQEILNRIKDADIVITASVDISSRVLRQNKSLKMLCLACSGYNRVDIATCNKLGISVTNVPYYAIDAVAEHTFALLLAIMKRIKEGDELIRRGRFTCLKPHLLQLAGRTFGIVGTGRIGSRVARIANCFGCNVIANTLHPSRERAKKLGLRYEKLSDLLKESDIISLHVPLNASTLNLIDHNEFNLMKKKPILVNTSRGKVINQNALIQALSGGKISGAGLDVLEHEPPQKNDPLFKLSNVVFSPHRAFRTKEALESCADTVIDNIESFIKNNRKNLISSFRK